MITHAVVRNNIERSLVVQLLPMITLLRTIKWGPPGGPVVGHPPPSAENTGVIPH